jgi:hypothetical protein
LLALADEGLFRNVGGLGKDLLDLGSVGVTSVFDA